MLYYIILIPFITILIAIWIIFINPLFKFKKYASRNIRRSTFNKLIEIDKNILTISSAAIILTVSLINKELQSSRYLLISWFSFLLSISTGVILYIANFTHDYTDEILSKRYYDLMKKSDKIELIDQSEIDLTKSIRLKQSSLAKSIFILIYFEITFLILALIMLAIFGYMNII